MDVEEQHRTVFAADRRQFTRLGNKISIRCLAVGDVNDDRRKSVRMLLTPRLGNLGGLLERGAHRSAPFPIWIEPDWKFDGLVHHSARAIVRFLYPVFDAQRLIGQFTDRYQRAPAQFTAERWFTAVFAVAQHTDMKVVVNRVGFGATDAQIVNEFVEDRRQLLGLPSASLSAAKRVFHRLRLVHQKQETTRVLTTDFGLVCHGFPPPFFGITRTTTLTCQRSQVGVLSRRSPECSNARPFCDIRRDELNTARSLLDSTHRANAL